MPRQPRAKSDLRFADIAAVNPRCALNGLVESDLVSFIPMADVDDGGRWAARQARPLQQVRTGYSAFADGDVLFAKITPCTENGKGCHATNLVNGIGFGSTEFHILRAKAGVLPRLVYHLSQSPDIRWKAAALMDGSAGQQRVPADFFRLCRIADDILDNQDAKCGLFDAVDEAIDATRRVIEQTRRLKTAVLQDLLTRGLPGRHSEFREHRQLGSYPADWKLCRLDQIARVERGKFTHRPRNDPAFYGGPTPFVQTSDVVNSGDYLRQHSQTLNARGLAVSRVFPKGTILFVIAGTVGEPTIASYDVAFPDSVVGITPRDGVNSFFLLRLLQFGHRRVVRTATESAQANISLELLRPLPFALPEPDEQAEIGRILRAVEERVEHEIESLDRLRLVKSALSQALLTGRVRCGRLHHA